VPDATTLEEAYRRAVNVTLLNQRIAEIAEEVREEAESTPVPKALAVRVAKELKKHPEKSWDEALTQIVKEELPEG
jgi:hypothetical protein